MLAGAARDRSPRRRQTDHQLAELTGEQGDVRGAYLLYQELGDTLRAQAGPFEGQTLDAYEGMARWIAKS
ncbi:hypothetical protein GT002_00980 [Streptomyces sp. SID4917]|nr:hypothetical protein [Streptomyces sp. SID4917]